MIWDGFVGVEVQAPYDTRTCGLCGNNDGVSDDNDFTPSGRMELGTLEGANSEFIENKE